MSEENLLVSASGYVGAVDGLAFVSFGDELHELVVVPVVLEGVHGPLVAYAVHNLLVVFVVEEFVGAADNDGGLHVVRGGAVLHSFDAVDDSHAGDGGFGVAVLAGFGHTDFDALAGKAVEHHEGALLHGTGLDRRGMSGIVAALLRHSLLHSNTSPTDTPTQHNKISPPSLTKLTLAPEKGLGNRDRCAEADEEAISISSLQKNNVLSTWP